jgi:hypothetical protein
MESFRKKLDSARRRAHAAEARTPDLEKLDAEKAEILEQLQENLRLTRQATIIFNQLAPVLQKLRDAQSKYALLIILPSDPTMTSLAQTRTAVGKGRRTTSQIRRPQRKHRRAAYQI